MKKSISIVLVVLLLATMTLPALAAAGNGSYGDVPKTADAITVDGEKDAVYDKGLKLHMDRQVEEYGDPATATNGDAYILWADGFLHVFGEIKDATIEVDEEKQSGEPWMTDSLEIFLDVLNDGEYSRQYRIDALGYRSFELRDSGDNSYGGDASTADGIYEGTAKQVDGGYNVEFKIPCENAAAGKQLGVLLQINDMDAGTRSMFFTGSSTGFSKSWETAEYDFINLVDTEVSGVAVELPEPVGTKMQGELIGSEGGWGDNPETGRAAAFDGDLTTFFDPAAASDPQYYCGMKMGEAHILSEIRICPRDGQLGRFNGASIYGFNGDVFDPETATLIWVSDAAAEEGGFKVISADQFIAGANTGFTSFAYFNLADHGDVAEIELYGEPGGASGGADVAVAGHSDAAATTTVSAVVPTGDGAVVFVILAVCSIVAIAVISRRKSRVTK